MANYTIRRGDTLSALAQRFNTTVEKLASTNKIANPNLIITGRTLKVPDSFEADKPARSVKQKAPAKTPDRTPSKAPAKTPRKTTGKSTPQQVALDRLPRATAAKYEYFKNKILEGGGKFRTGPGRMNLLGIRTPTNSKTNGGQGRYDDKLVAIWTDRSGKPHVREYKYNTEPAAAMRAYSADVSGDGVADQGRIPTGFYDYGVSSWKNGFCLRAKGDFRVERDMNHDGNFTENRRSGGGASMLFHQGGSGGTYSAGCQTFSPSEWSSFMRDMRGASGAIGYTLVQRA